VNFRRGWMVSLFLVFLWGSLIGGAPSAWAEIELVSLPPEGRSVVTIYKPANLTLVEQRREMTLTEGTNQLQFDWSGTKIDPTSVRLFFPEREDVRVEQVTYPAGRTEQLTWTIEAGRNGRTTARISYFTLGMSWDAVYQAELSRSEESMDLDGFVRVENQTGEAFENVRVRLLTGEVNILRSLSEVIRDWNRRHSGKSVPKAESDRREYLMSQARATMASEDRAQERRDISSEGVSEYQLLNVEGRVNLREGESKRLEFLSRDSVPVTHHFRYWPANREGVHRYLRFDNDTSARLGRLPLPSGPFQLYQSSRNRSVRMLGEPTLDYLPVGERARLHFGEARSVRVKRRRMNRATGSFEFDDDGDLSGWNETVRFRTTVRNFRDVPVEISVHHQFDTPYWEIIEHSHDYETVDDRRVKYGIELSAGDELQIMETIQFPHGTLRD
jgi:hypothetical protein